MTPEDRIAQLEAERAKLQRVIRRDQLPGDVTPRIGQAVKCC